MPIFKKSEGIKIQSPLRVEECVTVLKNATIEDTLLGTASVASGTIICKLEKAKFRLQIKKYGRDWAGPFLYGTLREMENGTQIEGEFRMHPVVFAIYVVCFGGMLIWCAVMAVTGLTEIFTRHVDYDKTGNPLLKIFDPVLKMVLVIAVIKFSKWLGRHKEMKMAVFLQELFAPKELSSRPDSQSSSKNFVQ